jgi:hypothetical protein
MVQGKTPRTEIHEKHVLRCKVPDIHVESLSQWLAFAASPRRSGQVDVSSLATFSGGRDNGRVATLRRVIYRRGSSCAVGRSAARWCRLGFGSGSFPWPSCSSSGPACTWLRALRAPCPGPPSCASMQRAGIGCGGCPFPVHLPPARRARMRRRRCARREAGDPRRTRAHLGL